MMKAKMTYQNVSMQTDPLPTKLMKDVALDQKGLIIMKDQGILTDGSVVKRLTGTFILTNSVAQLTEPIAAIDKSTQTALPRSEVAFMKLYQPDLGRIERELKEFDAKSAEQRVRRKKEINGLLRSFGQPVTDEGEETFDSLENVTAPSGLIEKHEAPSHNTYANWTNFDFDDDTPSLPRVTVSEGDQPWRNFKDLVMGTRLRNMTLSPIPLRRNVATKKKSVTWSDTHQKAVDDLLKEAANLIEIFDQVSIVLGPKLQKMVSPNLELTPPHESALQQIARQDAKLLADKLGTCQPRVFGEFKKLGPEFQQYI